MICKKLKECIQHESAEQSAICQNKNHSRCIQSSDNRTQIKCEENGKKYILENTLKKLVISYKMDDGVIIEDKSVPPNTSKCDYLYLICSNDIKHTAILIELKGTNVSKALEQLNGTLQMFPEVFESCMHVYGRIIVTSSLPSLKARPEYVKLVRKLIHTYHGNLKIVEKQFVEKDRELDK